MNSLSDMQRLAIRAEARLRAKSQLTIPEPIVDAVGVVEGDRFLIEVMPDEPDTIRFHRIRGSYAGALSEVYGDPADYLAEERRSWDRV
jgi:hypothetical protein